MKRLIHIAPVWAALFLAGAAFAGSGPGVAVGSVAPDFTLKNMEGKTVNLYDVLKEGPVLIDFWALWCKPCLHALPGTDEISKEYADKGVTVLTVNTDSPRSTAKVRSYVKSKKFSFEVLLDPNSDMMRLYRFRSIPQLFLVDMDHTIAFSKLGYSPGHEKIVIEEIDKILAGPSRAVGSEEG
ncbi:MAG: TlpA disulfide reductase family protein [Candidatus Eisenbacteria bacterium]